MHPDVVDAGLAALLDNLPSDVRMRRDHNPFHSARYGADVRIAGVALQLPSFRVDGKNFVPRCAKLLVDDVGSLGPSARDTRDCNALQSQELTDRCCQVTHDLASLRV